MANHMLMRIAAGAAHAKHDRWEYKGRAMAEWKDGRWVLPVGLSGLQYHTSMKCQKDEETVTRTVTDFYSGRRARRIASETPQALAFRRGSIWLGRLAGFLVLSETWPFQTIVVTLKPEAGATLVAISYDVRMYFSFVCRPNQIEKEAKQLKTLLKRG